MRQLRLALAAFLKCQFSTARPVPALIRRSFSVALSCLMWCLMISSATAQNMEYTQGKADQALRSDLRVDPSTLGMSIQVPIANYAGRGVSLPISLNYSSKVWRMNLDTSWENSSGAYTESRAIYAEFSKAGWTSSLSVPEIEWTGNQQVFDGEGNAYCTGCPGTVIVVEDQFYINRLSVHMPDGSSHELRKNDTPVKSDQLVHSGVYQAVDGSHLRYDADAHVLWLPDGSTYDLSDASYVYFRDRNGNTLTYNRSTRKWSDALGRTIDVPLPDSPAAQDYTYTMPSGAYTLKWRNLQSVLTGPNPELHYIGGLCGSSYTVQSPGLFGNGFRDRVCSTTERFNPVVLWQVIMPNGGAYTFNYNVYGEIDKVTYPTGGYERFKYQKVNTLSYLRASNTQANRGVVDRWVSPSGSGADEAPWHYETVYVDPLGLKVSTTAPDQTRSERFISAKHPDPPKPVLSTEAPYGFDDVGLGMAYEERSFSATGKMLRRSLTQWDASGPVPGGHSAAQRDPRIIKEVTILLDTDGDALTKTVTYGYDSDQNVITTSVFDYKALDSNTAQTCTISTIQQGTLLRTDESTFLVNDPDIDSGKRSDYRSRNLLSLPTSTRTRNAQGTIVAQSATRYDEENYPPLGYNTVTGWTDPQTKARGNVTTTGRWLNTTNTYLETHAQYDQFGNLRVAWDARGKQTQMEYDSAYAYTYLTKTTTPIPDPTNRNGSNTALTTTSTYNAATGRMLSTTDANGQVITFEYASTDVLGAANPSGRLTRITRPDGGWTAYAYGDQPGNLFRMTRTAQDPEHNLDAYQYLDGLGRSVRSVQSEGSGAYIYADTQYDQIGRVWKVSNPYRGGETLLWTTTEYDALGRARVVTTPDNAQVTTSYSGNTVTAQDQAGKKRTSVSDALGHLEKVVEAPGVVNYAYETTYEYDVLGNLKKVTQGKAGQAQQARLFTYDSLSRLLSATNPESGTTEYRYDENGNLVLKIDPRKRKGNATLEDCLVPYREDRVAVCYQYDELGRLKSRRYNDGTPDVTYFYDTGYTDAAGEFQLVNNARGLLTQVSSSASTYNYNSYDVLGRVKSSSQSTDGQTYSMSYDYDLAGKLKWEKYPSGRIVTASYDNAGRIGVIDTYVPGSSNQCGKLKPCAESRLPTASFTNYSAHGAPTDVLLANGLTEQIKFNARLQPTRIGLVKESTGESVLKLDYTYGTVVNGSLDATKNNGNVQSQRITLPGLDVTQSYDYDPLNRLTQVQESGGSSSWKQVYSYDQYGNRTFGGGTTFPALPEDLKDAVYNPLVDSATNRLVEDQGGDGQKEYEYDAAGNMVKNALGQTFAYDGDNMQVSYNGGPNTGGASYTYDPAGRRVKKVTAAGTTIFVYDAAGALVAEYSTESLPSAGGTKYLTTDNLGSPRVITNEDGKVVSRHDYAPFGEELFAGRTSEYQQDSVRQQFTGQEHDRESGLDYFDARYYSSTQGRFTSIDPLAASGRPGNPQTWNRYAYVLNNPMKFIDPTGMSSEDSSQQSDPTNTQDTTPQDPWGALTAEEQEAINNDPAEQIYSNDVTQYNEAVEKADTTASVCLGMAANTALGALEKAHPTDSQAASRIGTAAGAGALAGAGVGAAISGGSLSAAGAIYGELTALTLEIKTMIREENTAVRNAKIDFITAVDNCKLQFDANMPKTLPQSVINWNTEKVRNGGTSVIRSSNAPFGLFHPIVEKWRKDVKE